MPQFNPYHLKRAKPVVETRTFTDPANPDASLTLTLRAVNEAPFRLRVQEKAQENKTDFVLGRIDEESKVEAGHPPVRLPKTIVFTRTESGGMEPVDITSALCDNISLIEAMQEPEEAANGSMRVPNSFADLAAASVFLPNAWFEAVEWAMDLYLGKTTPLKTESSEPAPQDSGEENPLPAHTAPSSGSAANTTRPHTRK